MSSVSVDVLNQPLPGPNDIGQNKVLDDTVPPAKRRKTDLMDIKELAYYLREEVNLVTGKSDQDLPLNFFHAECANR